MFDKVSYPLQIVWEYPFPSLRYYVSYPVSLRSCLTKFHTPCKSCENTLSLPSDTMYRTPCHSGHVWQSFIPLANRVRIPLPFPQILCIVPHVTEVMFDKVSYPLQIVWEYPFPSLGYNVSYPMSLRSCLTLFSLIMTWCDVWITEFEDPIDEWRILRNLGTEEYLFLLN